MLPQDQKKRRPTGLLVSSGECESKDSLVRPVTDATLGSKKSVGRSASQNECEKDYKNANGGHRTSPNEPNWSINQGQSSMGTCWDLNNWKQSAIRGDGKFPIAQPCFVSAKVWPGKSDQRRMIAVGNIHIHFDSISGIIDSRNSCCGKLLVQAVNQWNLTSALERMEGHADERLVLHQL